MLIQRPAIHDFKTPAKLNLRLKVLGRRADGYHEIASIMVPVDLFDSLDVEVIEEGRMEFACEGIDLPCDERNLAFRAARVFAEKTGMREGIFIRLHKRIPVAAGLGGGSSDAAAVLLCLNQIRSCPLGISDLHQMAARLGADVPFFLYCRPSVATGIGDIIEPLENWPEFWYILVSPPIRVSTAWAYASLKLELTTIRRDPIIATLKNKGVSLSTILENDLEGVTSSQFSTIEIIKGRLIQAGAEKAMMSGSGPTVFGVFTSRDRAESAKRLLLSHEMGEVFLVTNWVRD